MSHEHVSRSCLSWNLQTWIISHVNLLSRPKNILGPGARSSGTVGRGRKAETGRCRKMCLCSPSLQKGSEARCKGTCREDVRTLGMQGREYMWPPRMTLVHKTKPRGPEAPSAVRKQDARVIHTARKPNHLLKDAVISGPVTPRSLSCVVT